MVSILIIIISIVILSIFINKKLINMEYIKESDLKNDYVNKLHKYVEKVLYIVNFIVMILAITDFHHLRPLIFIGPCIMYAFSTIMEWKYARSSKTYYLSAVTCVLFMIGSIIYGVIHYN
ncbi:DUF4181 domain-containing protein [Alkalicoccus daliensis]|uniref:DUF4181 domain-containing protein n=1 Tax=Alkalicoccus daliensis TaxID=745820 RepID=A0A1H0D5C4_9BACI|nr:DUF4181 domain-containing protein [Alkalicoccus daliensis]SDN65279.1 protein of unknown function [Alkalicoccus daliensis]